MADPRPQPEHGTRACYCHGCRCPDCREANSDYMRAHRAGKTAARAVTAATSSPSSRGDWYEHSPYPSPAWHPSGPPGDDVDD